MEEFLEGQGYFLSRENELVSFSRRKPLSEGQHILSILLLFVVIVVFVITFDFILGLFEMHFGFDFAIPFLFAFILWFRWYSKIRNQTPKIVFQADLEKHCFLLERFGSIRCDFKSIRSVGLKTQEVGSYASPFHDGNTEYSKTLYLECNEREYDLMEFTTRRADQEEEITEIVELIKKWLYS